MEVAMVALAVTVPSFGQISLLGNRYAYVANLNDFIVSSYASAANGSRPSSESESIAVVALAEVAPGSRGLVSLLRTRGPVECLASQGSAEVR